MQAGLFDSALGLMMIIGPIILLAALAYAIVQARRRSRMLDVHRERTTKKLYTDQRAQRDNLKGEESGRPPARPT